MEKLENLPSLPQENLILIDWLTFTVKTDDPAAVKEMIGLKSVSWEKCETGMNGYPEREFFGNISIMYGASPEMGVCCSMSGQGCRTFESYSSLSWLQLIELITHSDHIKVTRIDAAFDDHTGLLDIQRIRQDVDDRLYVSRSRKSRVTVSDDQNTDIKGISIEIGARSSDMLIRIYDKAAERGYSDDTHWIRIEMQMRDTIATGFVTGMIDSEFEFGTYFRGVLHNYLRFVTESEDTNKSRWPTADYWEKLLEGVCKIRVWSAPGVIYNMSRLENFVLRQAGNAIETYVKVFGWQKLNLRLKERNVELPLKYRKLLQDYGIL